MTNIARTLLAVVLIAIAAALPALARGKRLPPPPFMGGSAGAWLQRGTLFNDPDHPLGPGFGEPMDGNDEDPFGGGTGWGYDDGGTGGTGSKGGAGCPGNCNFETMTGPCEPVCECYVQMGDGQGAPEEGVSYAYGSCIRVGYYQNAVDSSCKEELDRCSVAIQAE